MKGCVKLRTDVNRPYWRVHWWHVPHNKEYKISRYPGETEVMYQTHPIEKHDIGKRKADKLMALMQGDTERGVFRIEKYIGEIYTDVIPYLRSWLDARHPTLTPGGYKKYRTAVEQHLVPFFEQNQIMLHEIKYDTLVQLLNCVKGSGKNKKNVVDTLRCCLKYAWKSERIQAVPPFPERNLYDIRQKQPVWLPTERYNEVIKYIPEEDKPFFMWLYLHLRRPGEACALLKEDYDSDQDIFIVRRGVSNGQLIDRTKTGEIHIIPCHSEFKPYLNLAMNSNPFSPFLFTCRDSRVPGKRYTEKVYRRIWKEACGKAGENIDVYRGTKTSRASQLMNEVGITRAELQIAGDWARIESTEAYAKASVAKKREILEKK